MQTERGQIQKGDDVRKSRDEVEQGELGQWNQWKRRPSFADKIVEERYSVAQRLEHRIDTPLSVVADSRLSTAPIGVIETPDCSRDSLRLILM